MNRNQRLTAATIEALPEPVALSVRASETPDLNSALQLCTQLSNDNPNREVILLVQGREEAVFVNGACLDMGALESVSAASIHPDFRDMLREGIHHYRKMPLGGVIGTETTVVGRFTIRDVWLPGFGDGHPDPQIFRMDDMTRAAVPGDDTFVTWFPERRTLVAHADYLNKLVAVMADMPILPIGEGIAPDIRPNPEVHYAVDRRDVSLMADLPLPHNRPMPEGGHFGGVIGQLANHFQVRQVMAVDPNVQGIFFRLDDARNGVAPSPSTLVTWHPDKHKLMLYMRDLVQREKEGINK